MGVRLGDLKEQNTRLKFFFRYIFVVASPKTVFLFCSNDLSSTPFAAWVAVTSSDRHLISVYRQSIVRRRFFVVRCRGGFKFDIGRF